MFFLAYFEHSFIYFKSIFTLLANYKQLETSEKELVPRKKWKSLP